MKVMKKSGFLNSLETIHELRISPSVLVIRSGQVPFTQDTPRITLMLSPVACAVLAALTGAALELGVHAVSGRREAWDSELFWIAGLPVALLISLAIGFLSRGRGWLGTLAVAPGQVLAMTLRSGDIGSLWPLALLLSMVLSAPFVAAAFVGAKLRGRRTE